jgi:hypothetical protein
LSVPPSNARFFALLAGSYLKLVGRPLLPADQVIDDPATWLYEEAPYCVLAHNTDADPCFIYANRTAQACFGYTWSEFTSLPSRLSAEGPNREERQRLLDQVSSQGFASGYSGLRISKTGRRFWIEDGTVWQLIDDKDIVHGQAAIFATWRDT